MLLLLVCFSAFGFCYSKENAPLFSWNLLEYDVENFQGDYVPENNLPLGIGLWQDKIFVTVPRWRHGVLSTLNVIHTNASEVNPKLAPYPNWEANNVDLTGTARNDQIVSALRVRVDACDRLWVLDHGNTDHFETSRIIRNPSLLIYDLNTDNLLHRYEFTDSDLLTGYFFVDLEIDVRADRCGEAFAYVSDNGRYGLVVYSLQTNRSWRIQQNYFYPYPLAGNFFVAGLHFQWSDGLFGLAMTQRDRAGFRTLYFHSIVGWQEFSVSTRALRNETLALSADMYDQLKYEGFKGYNTESSSNIYDEKSGVLFQTQINRNTLGCWNTKKQLCPRTFKRAVDDRNFIFPNDLKFDDDRNLFVLVNKLPILIYSQFNRNETNFRIYKLPLASIIKRCL